MAIKSGKNIVFILLLSFCFSCNTEEPAFYVYKENDFVMEVGSGTFATYFATIYNINNNFVKELEAFGISSDQIKAVNSGRGSFVPIFEEVDFDLLRDVSIWLISAEDPSKRKEIYYRDQIPLNQKNELRLLSGLSNLKDFLLTEEKYHLEIQLKFRNLVPANIETRFSYSFAIFMN
jgi:hypothetical protein